MRSKGKIFSCEYCNKEFKYRSKYVEHLRTHTGERPFPCSFCDASFTQRGALKQHERIHTGDRPHYCGICDKSFRTASALTLHLRIHPGSSNISHYGTVSNVPYFDIDEKVENEFEYEDQQEAEYVQILV